MVARLRRMAWHWSCYRALCCRAAANRTGCPMRKSKADFVDLVSSGEYYVLQKRQDRNRDDITLKREDGLPAEIHNFPYRINQMPTYIFNELLEEGFLKEDAADEQGGIIFRPARKKREPSAQAA